jgi:hypothetical protein
LIAVCSAFSANAPAANAEEGDAKLITGKAAMGDWTSDAHGVRPQNHDPRFAGAQFESSGN